MEKKSAPKLQHDSHDSMLNIKTVPAYFLLACLLIALYFLIVLLTPFSTVIVFAAILATAFHPIYRAIDRRLKHAGISSAITCLLIIFLIIVPFIVLLFLLASEGVNAYVLIQHKLDQGFLAPLFSWQHSGPIYDWYTRLLPGIDLSTWDIPGQITNLAKQASGFFLSWTQALITDILGFTVDFLIMIFTMYYFIKDGPAIVKKIMVLSPLPEAYEEKLFKRLKDMTQATLYGTFLTAIIQGIVGGIGFALAGIDEPVLWGTVMAIFALAPYVGTAFVWIPATIILFITGSTGPAIFLLGWSLLFVSTIDNFLLPYLIGSRANTYSLLTFLCVMGGIFTWGVSGIALGPFVLTIMIAMSEIYEAEYRPMLKQLDHDQIS